MRAVNQAVEDCVGQSGIPDIVMPVRHGQLARHDAGAGADPIIDQLQKIVALSGSDGSDGKIVDDEHADLGDRGEALAEAAIGMAEVELLEQTRCAYVQRAQALAAGLMRESTGEVSLPAPRQAGNIVPIHTYSTSQFTIDFTHDTVSDSASSSNTAFVVNVLSLSSNATAH